MCDLPTERGPPAGGRARHRTRAHPPVAGILLTLFTLARRRIGTGRRARIGCALLLATPAMARDPSLAASITRFFAGPLVRSTFLVCGFPALTCNLALLGRIHRRESTIFFGHLVPPHPLVPARFTRTFYESRSEGCNGGATPRCLFVGNRCLSMRYPERGDDGPFGGADYRWAERICRARAVRSPRRASRRTLLYQDGQNDAVTTVRGEIEPPNRLCWESTVRGIRARFLTVSRVVSRLRCG